jgi:hypothetical protein
MGRLRHSHEIEDVSEPYAYIIRYVRCSQARFDVFGYIGYTLFREISSRVQDIVLFVAGCEAFPVPIALFSLFGQRREQQGSATLYVSKLVNDVVDDTFHVLDPSVEDFEGVIGLRHEPDPTVLEGLVDHIICLPLP